MDSVALCSVLCAVLCCASAKGGIPTSYDSESNVMCTYLIVLLSSYLSARSVLSIK